MIPVIISAALSILALIILHKSRKMLAEATEVYNRAIAAQTAAIKLNNETIAMRAAMINERKPAPYSPYVDGKFVP